MEFALTSLDQTATTTENLINYTFNVRWYFSLQKSNLICIQQSSYDTNQVM